MEDLSKNNLAKELLTVITFSDEQFLQTLPADFIRELTLLAADADQNFTLRKDKKLNEQISEDCRNWLAIIYYQSLNSEKKEELLNLWLQNEIKE